MIKASLTIIAWFFCSMGAMAQSGTKEDSLKIIKQKILEKRVAIDSVKYWTNDSSDKKLIVRNNETLYILRDPKHGSFWDYLLAATPILISLLLLLVTQNAVKVSKKAVEVSERALKISEDALKVSNEALIKERTNKQLDIISAIDTKLTESPHLWAIYDQHAHQFSMLPEGMNAEELNASLDGFCYFHLNNFEMVFRHPSDENDKQVWENYMVNTMVESSRFRKIASRAIKMYIYNDKYQEIIKRLLKTANELLPIFDQYKEGKITEDEYYAAARIILNKADRKI